MSEDIVDRYGNQIHIACLALQRLRRREPFASRQDFQRLVEEYCQNSRAILQLIRALASQADGCRWKDAAG